MDISNIDSTVIQPIKTDPVAPANIGTVPPATTANPAAATASIVEFSPLAQLLAVTVLFQTKQAQQIAPGATSNPGSTSFQELVAAANAFVSAFNAFQDSINGSYATSFEVAFDNALLSAMQDGTGQAGSNSIQSFIDNMAQLGINFQGGANTTNPNYFQFDLTALEQAYANSPEQTAALLNYAFQGLGTIEEQLMLTQPTQELNQNLMTQQTTTYAIPNPNNAVGANGAPAGVVTAAAVTEAASVAVTIAAAAATNASGTTAPVTPPATTPAAPVTPANPPAFDPVTTGPLVAQAVAAYRVVENITPPPTNLLIPTPTVETVPDIIETTRVEPIGPDTPKGPTPRAQQQT